MAVGGVVGGDVGRAGGDRDRAAEVDLLPAARAFAGEGGACEQRAVAAPEAARCACPCWRALVEADTSHLAGDARRELDAELDRLCVEAVTARPGRRRPRG